jgi:hypothetical protein
MTFDPPPVFLYNAHRKQGVSPNAAQFNCVLSTGLRPMDKTLFVSWQATLNTLKGEPVWGTVSNAL